ncbi:membrane associated rhomboid family serine protease [Tamaricihabitans halophyticus]|uniref:Membrane associated rhomboid family serine protease n=1 Tax=Tamaricihabitans halophyticus TaxID=1262583 RepID=A0A4R2QEP6_9PSEU|nr:membrane associated rhomboid family serine protease [Tamaricihabitans halophyticus]
MLPPRLKQSAIVIVGFTALLYLVELLDVVLPVNLDNGGIVSRSLSGLDGVLWAPLLHGDWAHLLANTAPVLIFGFLAMAGGLGPWIAVTATIWILGGLGVWLIGPGGNTVTIGASGVAFGWLAFLLVRGLFNRSIKQIGLAVLLLAWWGSMLWGILPGEPGISWQGHLFGALAGILAAWLYARANRGKSAGQASAAASGPATLGTELTGKGPTGKGPTSKGKAKTGRWARSSGKTG